MKRTQRTLVHLPQDPVGRLVLQPVEQASPPVLPKRFTIRRLASSALLRGVVAAVLLTPARTRAGEGVVQCANLVYGVNHTSRCFSDEFLSAVQKETTIPTERRFKSIKLASDELFSYPFAVMTGESDFRLTVRDREHLKTYLCDGGFLLASAGCSNKDWDRAFRREMRVMFGENALKQVPMEHPVFRTVHKVKTLKLHHPAAEPRLEGVEINGKLVVIYSPHGLNDTAHTEGCCCCGGNEIVNSLEVNVNILVYALLH